MGSPASVGEFCEQRAVPFGCLADPDRTAYRAFGLTTGGMSKLINPGSVLKGVKLYAKGMTTGLPHAGQDIRQMPGTFVIWPGGRIRFAHYNADAGDNPPMPALLGALGAQ